MGAAAQDDARQEVALPPQDRVLAVRPFWETVPQEERVQLLSLSLEELRVRAEELTQRQLKEHGARQETASSWHQSRTLPGCAGLVRAGATGGPGAMP